MQRLRTRLPPPNALLAFEAAARHLSFTLAARELSVTRVAVSTQVKILEDFLGMPLFLRLHRALQLTPAGERLSQCVSKSLGEIVATTEALRSQTREQRVTVTTTTGVASCWLLPSLNGFRQRHPDIDLRFLISDAYLDLEAESVDVAIRYGVGEWPRVDARLLARESIFPLCSPAYLATRDAPSEPRDLLQHTLLHLDGPYDPQTRWATWFQSQEVVLSGPVRGLTFNTYSSLVQATLAGQGIALLGPPLLGPLQRDGTLVRPIDVAPTPRRSFWLATPQHRPLSPACQAFCAWVEASFQSEGAT